MRRKLWARWGMFRRRFAPGEPERLFIEQLGALRSAPARSEDGEAIGKQEEVFVVRYEKGIAYVRRWEDMWTARGTRDHQTTSR